MTDRNDAVIVTVRDAIHAGISLGITRTGTLNMWRELGGAIRDEEFSKAWDTELEAFRQWRKLQKDSSFVKLSD